MAPPPEYDKEPKAPDKSVTNITTDDSKVLYNLVKEQQNNSDHKPSNSAANADVENNKHVGALDDGQLRALLDEAIAYKRPKDREGKSSLFKELLEEVEQDEQACEAAARVVTGPRGGARRPGHGRRALPHSNSLQDLMAAALAAEPPRQRAHAHPPPASVSARAHHGGSLPSGVDTSSMLGEEPTRGGYLATVRCVNPPPLSERRVSASDTNAPLDHDHNRRGKQSFPMTYTARATLEIGGSSVCTGRAVTTTTPSNQVRTAAAAPPAARPARHNGTLRRHQIPAHQIAVADDGSRPKRETSVDRDRPPPNDHTHDHYASQRNSAALRSDEVWTKSVESWYEGLNNYFIPSGASRSRSGAGRVPCAAPVMRNRSDVSRSRNFAGEEYGLDATEPLADMMQIRNEHKAAVESEPESIAMMEDWEKQKVKKESARNVSTKDSHTRSKLNVKSKKCLVVPALSATNPKSFRNTTIGSITEDTLNRRFCESLNESHNASGYKKRENEFRNDLNASIAKSQTGIDNCEDPSKGQTLKSKHFVEEYEGIPLAPTEAKDSRVYEMLDISRSNFSECTDRIEMTNISSKDSGRKCSFSKFVDEQQKLFEKLQAGHEIDKEVLDTKESDEDTGKVNNNKLRSNTNNNLHETNNENYGKIKDSELNRAENVTVASEIEERFDNPTTATLPTKRPSLTNTPIDDPNSKAVQLKYPKTVVKGDADRNEPDSCKRSTLTVLLLENLFRGADKLFPGVRVLSGSEIDSAIPFSCITTPEVVASCNTTTSTGQPATAVDPKPLQPGPGYRAVSCLTGEQQPRRAAPTPAPPPAPPASPAHQQPRSVISSSFNGLPLTRPGYGSGAAAASVCTAAAAGTAAADECKKSLDENGNSVQGFSSPLSGSSQHKKPRRKKSSKNETVIKSQEIDGYQGNKDLNEVLRFIESNAEGARGAKAGGGRAKHKDDAEDKAAKKRSTERRKDAARGKVKRATSMEELSRTKLEDLTDKPAARTEPAKPAKPERRSWGDDAREPRDAFYLQGAEPKEPAEPAELTDFQTVTKKRKPRRRPDEPEPPRRAPRPAPPSDRSNDSNDDMDSVHSLPAEGRAAAPPPPAHASYADIARTRHNIPDLIESCNYYAEGEPEGGGERARRDAAPEAAAAPAPADGDYPALLETRAARRRDKGAARPARKERPAPDVVADRRPPVILLDCASRPRDMDGVTFGFDINEQLVGGARRPRCDLVRDALEGGGAAPVSVPLGGGAALRYVPPAHARHDQRHLHQIVDYVGAAWEDVVRCGSGKVRYFSE
ncbi:unnamed protein product, partial [Iphiclides podalirius]